VIRKTGEEPDSLYGTVTATAAVARAQVGIDAVWSARQQMGFMTPAEGMARGRGNGAREWAREWACPIDDIA